MQKPQIVSIAYHYKNTDIEFRDRLSLTAEKAMEFLRLARELPSPLEELAVVSTCNRTEFYGVTAQPQEFLQWLVCGYEKIKQFSFPINSPKPDIFCDQEAILHFCSVAAGLESMVLGENQILSQIKASYDILLSIGSSPLLGKMFQHAIQCGKAVRHQTELCQGAVSISLAAVELSRKIFSSFERRKILVVGAGETAELVATHFCSFGARQFLLANRSLDNATKMAETLPAAKVVSLPDIPRALSEVDIVVTATNSPDFLLHHEHIRNEFKVRDRSLLLLDISTPRNIDPKIKDISDVFLYNIDDLEGVVRSNLDKRKAEIPAARQIVDEIAEEFSLWYKSLELVPTIKGLAGHFDNIRYGELQRFANKVTTEEYQILDEFARRLTKKLLHYPISTLQKMNNGGHLDLSKIDFIREMYQLYDKDDCR